MGALLGPCNVFIVEQSAYHGASHVFLDPEYDRIRTGTAQQNTLLLVRIHHMNGHVSDEDIFTIRNHAFIDFDQLAAGRDLLLGLGSTPDQLTVGLVLVVLKGNIN